MIVIKGLFAYLLIMSGMFFMYMPNNKTMYLVAMFLNGLWFLIVIRLFRPKVSLEELGFSARLYHRDAIHAGIFGVFVPLGIFNILEEEVWLKLSFFRSAPIAIGSADVIQSLIQEGLIALLLLIAINGIFMAAIQESFFRGFLLPLWAQGGKFWVANIAVSVLFLLFHWPFDCPPLEAAWKLLSRAPGIFVLSLLAGLIWSRWGIAAAIIGHVALNFISSLIPLLKYLFISR